MNATGKLLSHPNLYFFHLLIRYDSIISYANSHQTDPSWYVPNTSSKDATFPATHNMPHILPALPSAADSIPPNAHQFDYLEVSSTSSSEEEPIIEQLERERRQWQSERERLLQCIHLQQLELSQRALAAQERALEIAQVCMFFVSSH